MKGKNMKTVIKGDLDAFVNTLSSIVDQCARMKSVAKAQGKATHPAAEYLEMHDRLEKAATSFIGEKRRLLESRDAYFSRIMKIMSSPERLILAMHRNGRQLRV